MRLSLWLKDVQNIMDLQQLTIICYDARGNQIEELKHKASEADCLKDLAHYIGRLGAHRQAVSIIVSAMMEVPSLQQISSVRLVPPSEVRKITLQPHSPNLYDMVKRICQKASDVTCLSSLHAFVEIDLERDLQHEMLRNHHFSTRVHAELLLVDLFCRKSFDFVDNDKYIGCSKGACYFCYSWISMHHKNFVLPPCHNKVILGCRASGGNPGIFLIAPINSSAGCVVPGAWSIAADGPTRASFLSFHMKCSTGSWFANSV
jgi:hypothetical protein